MMGGMYISFLIFFVAAAVLWAGIRIVLRFVLSQCISIQNDKLSIMALKSPELGHDREYNFAMMVSHANMAAVDSGASFLFGQYYQDIIAALDKSFGDQDPALSVSGMENTRLRELVNKSSICFTLLLVLGSWNGIKCFCYCLFAALRRAKAKQTSFSVAVIDASSQISRSTFMGMGKMASA